MKLLKTYDQYINEKDKILEGSDLKENLPAAALIMSLVNVGSLFDNITDSLGIEAARKLIGPRKFSIASRITRLPEVKKILRYTQYLLKLKDEIKKEIII